MWKFFKSSAVGGGRLPKHLSTKGQRDDCSDSIPRNKITLKVVAIG